MRTECAGAATRSAAFPFSVAAGVPRVPPALKPGILALRILVWDQRSIFRSELLFGAVLDAALYGSQDGCRYSCKPTLNTYRVRTRARDWARLESCRPRNACKGAVIRSYQPVLNRLLSPFSLSRRTGCRQRMGQQQTPLRRKHRRREPGGSFTVVNRTHPPPMLAEKIESRFAGLTRRSQEAPHFAKPVLVRIGHVSVPQTSHTFNRPRAAMKDCPFQV